MTKFKITVCFEELWRIDEEDWIIFFGVTWIHVITDLADKTNLGFLSLWVQYFCLRLVMLLITQTIPECLMSWSTKVLTIEWCMNRFLAKKKIKKVVHMWTLMGHIARLCRNVPLCLKQDTFIVGQTLKLKFFSFQSFRMQKLHIANFGYFKAPFMGKEWQIICFGNTLT